MESKLLVNLAREDWSEKICAVLWQVKWQVRCRSADGRRCTFPLNQEIQFHLFTRISAVQEKIRNGISQDPSSDFARSSTPS